MYYESYISTVSTLCQTMQEKFSEHLSEFVGDRGLKSQMALNWITPFHVQSTVKVKFVS